VTSLPANWLARTLLGSALLAGVLACVALYGWQLASAPSETKVEHFLINVIFVVALQVFSGNSGILSFGQMAFAGAGAYTASILTIDPLLKPTLLTGLPHDLQNAHVSFATATLAAGAVAGAFALVTGLAILRLDGASAVIAILSLLLVADVVFDAWIGVTRGAGGLYAIPDESRLGRVLVASIAAVAAARVFKDSRSGLLLQGSREDAFSAASVGVPVRAYRMRAWVLSGIMSGIAGALLAFWLGTISPTNFFLAPTFAIIVMFIVGGMNTVTGAVAGAGIVTLVQEVARPHEEDSLDLGVFTFHRLTGLTQLVLVALILLVMYVRREGLFGRRELDELLLDLGRGREGSGADESSGLTRSGA
jgi:branched-chain amino acid transport system ATP-binding protein/branched-chain amino acid transport system permease protein